MNHKADESAYDLYRRLNYNCTINLSIRINGKQDTFLIGDMVEIQCKSVRLYASTGRAIESQLCSKYPSSKVVVISTLPRATNSTMISSDLLSHIHVFHLKDLNKSINHLIDGSDGAHNNSVYILEGLSSLFQAQMVGAALFIYSLYI
jgi:hypothetical protein